MLLKAFITWNCGSRYDFKSQLLIKNYVLYILFYCFTVQPNLLCGESKVPFITFRIFSLLSQPCKILIQVFIVLKPDIICTFLIHYAFLIHYGSLQKMLTALFNFVWNTQKSKWKFLFECPGKMFLSIEKVFKR